VAIRNFIFISPRPQLVGVSPASIAGRWRVLAERSSRCTRWVGTGKPLDTLGILSLDQDDGGLDQNESAALLSAADAILRHNPESLTWIYSTIFTAGEGERDELSNRQPGLSKRQALMVQALRALSASPARLRIAPSSNSRPAFSFPSPILLVLAPAHCHTELARIPRPRNLGDGNFFQFFRDGCCDLSARANARPMTGSANNPEPQEDCIAQ
jgi:hypothetical protein